MSTITRPRSSVKAGRQPLNVRLTLEVRGTSYGVEPIPPGPDNSKAYRLVKQAGAGEVYDLARTNDGLVICDCPSFVASHEGTSSTCKHGSAMILMGLLDAPHHIAGEKAPAPVAEPAPESAMIADLLTPPVVPAFDPEPYRITAIVAKGDASWVNAGPTGGATPPCWVASTPAHAPCCPDELEPCEACRGGEWDDDHVWNLGPNAEPIGPPPAEDHISNGQPVPCPRCEGTGRRAFERPGGAEAEECSSCNGTGLVDAETALTLFELMEAEEDGAFEEAPGEAPLGYATPECFVAVAEGRAEFAREFGWVPSPDFVTRANAEDLLADFAVDAGWASRPKGWFEAMIASAGPAPEPVAEPALAEQVDAEARHYLTLGTPVAKLIARTLYGLAARVRSTEAADPTTYLDRVEVLEDEVRKGWYEAGLRVGQLATAFDASAL